MPGCAAVLHHGGSGTTSAALVSGCPQVSLPSRSAPDAEATSPAPFWSLRPSVQTRAPDARILVTSQDSNLFSRDTASSPRLFMSTGPGRLRAQGYACCLASVAVRPPPPPQNKILVFLERLIGSAKGDANRSSSEHARGAAGGGGLFFPSGPTEIGNQAIPSSIRLFLPTAGGLSSSAPAALPLPLHRLCGALSSPTAPPAHPPAFMWWFRPLAGHLPSSV